MYSLTKTVTATKLSVKRKATFIYVCLLEVSDEQKFIQLFSLGDSVVNSGLETYGLLANWTFPFLMCDE